MTNSSPSIWHLLRNVKFTVKIFFNFSGKHEFYLGNFVLVHSSIIEIRILYYLLLCRLLGFKFWWCHFRFSQHFYFATPHILWSKCVHCTYYLWNIYRGICRENVRNFFKGAPFCLHLLSSEFTRQQNGSKLQ